MWLTLFVKLFLGQVIAIALVVIVLKKILDKNLIELAIRQIEFCEFSKKSELPNIVITTHKKLNAKHTQSLFKTIEKKFGASSQPLFKIDRGILGGIIIHVNEQRLEYSLKDRLLQAIRTM